MAGHVTHKLQELLHKKEVELGERKTLSYHAKQMKISKRSLERWLSKDNKTTRFDADMLAIFCEYFNVEVGDILVYEKEVAE